MEQNNDLVNESGANPDDGSAQADKEVVYTSSLDEMIAQVATEPPQQFIIRGIKENTLGIVFGPPKTGKTTWCENLLMSIAAGETEFLGQPLNIKNRKALMISLEEHYIGRTERNKKQLERLKNKYGSSWLKNYIVVTKHLPRYIETEEHWALLKKIIEDVRPGIVVIDSLSHLHEGPIEESMTAKKLMQNLKELAEETKTTICVIHHSHKLYDKPLRRDNMAGSRWIAQELDYLYGMNRTDTGKWYIKEVEFRHCDANHETVTEFRITPDCWIELKGEAKEHKLLQQLDGRTDDTNSLKIMEFIDSRWSATDTIKSSDLISALVDTDIMARATFFDTVEKLQKDGKIIRLSKGKYRKAA